MEFNEKQDWRKVLSEYKRLYLWFALFYC